MLKTNNLLLPILIILGLFIIIAVQHCSINKLQSQVSDYKEWNKYYSLQIDSFKNKLNQVVTEAQVAQVDNQKEIKALSDQVFNLKKSDEKHIKQVNALIRVIQSVKLDSPIVIPYHDTVDRNDSSLVPKNTVIIPPREFNDSTKNYQINGTVLLSGVRINSLVLPDTSSLRIVEKKEGFFKKRELVIQGVHSNELFKTQGMQTVIKRGEKPSRWQAWGKSLVVAIISSYLTYKVVK